TEQRETENVRECGRREEHGADEICEPRGTRVLERPFTENALDELEVGEAGKAVAPSECQPDHQLKREEGQGPPPAEQNSDEREGPDDNLVEPGRPRVDDVEVAVGIRAANGCSSSLHFVKYCRGQARAQAASASRTLFSRWPSLVSTYSTCGG